MSEENDELICPITLELFRDPVRAADGHVYEREAITKWILEHGTSPLTRQTLNIGDLRPDEHFKKLARERRNSSVSYKAENERVILPSISFRLGNLSQITPERGIHFVRHHSRRDYSYKIILLLIFVSYLIPVAFINGIYFGLKNSFSAQLSITSFYSQNLSSTNSFNHSLNSTEYFYYQLISINLTSNGFYGFEIGSGSIVSIDADLYLNSFNQSNLVNYFYKDSNYINTYFGLNLQSGYYILMITTWFCCGEGPYTIRITGPSNILF